MLSKAPLLSCALRNISLTVDYILIQCPEYTPLKFKYSLPNVLPNLLKDDQIIIFNLFEFVVKEVNIFQHFEELNFFRIHIILKKMLFCFGYFHNYWVFINSDSCYGLLDLKKRVKEEIMYVHIYLFQTNYND